MQRRAQIQIIDSNRQRPTHPHTHTQKDGHFSLIQGTLSFGSLSEWIDFNLSGVDFQEQIIEPLNLICCLWGPQRTVITWWSCSEQPAPPRPLSIPHRLHKTWQITFNIMLSLFVLHECVCLCAGGGSAFHFFKKRCVNWQNGLRHILDTLMQCGYTQTQHHKAHFTRLHLAVAPKRVLHVSFLSSYRIYIYKQHVGKRWIQLVNIATQKCHNT